VYYIGTKNNNKTPQFTTAAHRRPTDIEMNENGWYDIVLNWLSDQLPPILLSLLLTADSNNNQQPL
jgi:hypothetical protein